MKYFTPEWWSTGGEQAGIAFERYEAYLASVRAHLPPALVDLEAHHTLHDSEVKHVDCDFQIRSVAMRLNGWDRALQYPVHYCLRFLNVSLFEQVLPQQEYVESELGDLGYWECELLGSEVEVRMLFASDAEFRIRFQDFGFSHEQVTA